MSSKITDCIKINVKDKQLRSKIVKDFKASGAVLDSQYKQELYITDRLKSLKTQRKAMLREARKILYTPMAKRITKPLPTTVDTQPTVEPNFNEVRAYFKPKSKEKLQKNVLQNFYNFTTSLARIISIDQINSFIKQHIGKKFVNDRTSKMLVSMSDFMTKFDKELTALFQQRGTSKKNPSSVKWKEYIHQDMLQYFTDNNSNTEVLDPNIKAAIAAVAYKWVSTDSVRLQFHTDDAIRKMLHLNPDAKLSNEIRTYVAELGLSETLLVDILGDEIYSLLNIDIDKSASKYVLPRLKAALGMMAIATLESQDILEIQHVYTGNTTHHNTKTTKEEEVIKASDFGLNWLTLRAQNKTDIRDAKLVSLIKPGDAYIPDTDTSEQMVNFYKIGRTVNKQLNIEDTRTIFKEAKDVWDNMFHGQNNQIDYTYDKPYVDEDIESSTDTMPIQGSDERVTVQQTKNQKKYINNPIKVIAKPLNILLAMSDDLRNRTLGIRNPQSQHVSTEKAVESVNNSIDRNWKDILGWLVNADGNFDKAFYIKSRFIAMGRSMMHGSIDTQNKKMHRYLFSSITSTISTKKFSAGETRLLMGVGFGFGKEVSKLGTPAEVLSKTRDILEKPIVIRAIKAIRGLGKDFDTIDPTQSETRNKHHSEALQAISDAVIEIGEESTGVLLSLVEYAGYLDAQEAGQKTYETRLMLEVDGLSNGPMLGLINFLTANTYMRAMLTVFRNSGWIFHKDQISTERLLTNDIHHDIYKTSAFAWYKNLIAKQVKLKKDGKTDTLKRINAVTELIGNLSNQTGEITNTIRKLTKDPALTTLFGIGKKTLIENFISDTIIQQGIYDKIYEIVNLNDTAEIKKQLAALNKNVSTLIDRPFMKNYELDYLRNLKLTKKDITNITKHVTKNHGAALYESIQETFGEFVASRTTINNTIIYATDLYNKVLILKVKEVQDKQPGILLTIQQQEDIEASIEHLLPKLTTPFGGKIDLTKKTRVRHYTQEPGTETAFSYRQVEGRKKVTRKKHIISTREGRADPGLRAPILSLHNMDAFVANVLSGGPINILNVFDGFYTGLNSIDTVAQKANKTLYDLLDKYHVARQLQKAGERSFNNTIKTLDALGLTQEQINVILDKSYKDAGLENKKSEDSILEQREGLLFAAKEYAAAATKGKRSVLNKVVGLNHYNFTKGTWFTGKTGQKKAFKMDAESAERTHTEAQLLETLRNTQLGSTPTTEIDTDTTAYENKQKVTQANVLDIYNDLKSRGILGNKDSTEHDQHLQHMIESLISKVMNEANLYTTTDETLETQGLYEITKDDISNIFMLTQVQGQSTTRSSSLINQGMEMSPGEIYVHEFIHAITHSALLINSPLISKLKVLRNLAKKELGADGYKLFLKDQNIDVNDPANVDAVASAKARYDYVFNDAGTFTETRINPITGREETSTYTNKLAEFLAFGLTNENFRNALSKINLKVDRINIIKGKPFKDIRGKNLQQTLINLLTKIVEIINTNYNIRRNKLDVAQELEFLTRKLVGLDQKNKSVLYKALHIESVLYSKAGVAANNYIKKAFKTWPITKTLHGLHGAGLMIRDSDWAAGKSIRKFIDKWYNMEYSLTHAVIDEVIGEKEILAPVYDALSSREIILDDAQEHVINAQLKAFSEFFKRPLEKAEKVTILKTLIKSDLSALKDFMSTNDIMDLVKSKDKLELKIKEIQDELFNDTDLKPYYHFYNKAAEALGFFMQTKKGRKHAVTFTNAKIIAELNNTKYDGTLTDAQVHKAHMLVEQLSSLYGLSHTAIKERKAMASIFDEDADGVELVLAAHNRIKTEARVANFTNSEKLMMKGYTKSIINNNKAVAASTLVEEAAYLKMGFTRSALPLPQEKIPGIKTVDMYLYVGDTQGNGNDLVHGAASNTGNVSKGTDLSNLDLNDQDIDKVMKHKEAIIDAMFSPNYPKESVNSNSMIAQTDPQGKVTSYRYMMQENTLDEYMEQMNEYDIVLSAMRGQTLNKEQTVEVNKTLIDALWKVYQDDYSKHPGSYVEVSPFSDDSDLRDFYHMLPGDTKQYLKKVWGDKRMFVRKDILATAFGFRKYSIMEAFNKNPEDRKFIEKLVINTFQFLFRSSTQKVLNYGEKLTIDIASMAKNNIVIKNAEVTGGNFISNIMYLRSRGVPNNDITRYIAIAIKQGTLYQAHKLKRDSIQIKLDVLKDMPVTTIRTEQIKNMQQEVKDLKDEMARNPLKDFIENGGMPQFVDEIDTSSSAGTLYKRGLDKSLDKVKEGIHKKNKVAGRILDRLFLTENTEEYKLLNNAVKMTDFTARYALFMHYMDKKTDVNMTEKEAMTSVIREFVNFSLPTHRILEYGNSIGLLWFTRYQLRIFRTMYSSFKDKPFEAMTTFALSEVTGAANIFYSIPGITKGAFQGIGNAYSTAVASLPNISSLRTVSGTADILF